MDVRGALGLFWAAKKQAESVQTLQERHKDREFEKNLEFRGGGVLRIVFIGHMKKHLEKTTEENEEVVELSHHWRHLERSSMFHSSRSEATVVHSADGVS